MTTTTKSKAGNRQVKNPGRPESMNKNNASIRNRKPTEEQIREKAQEIYNQRMVRGEYGTEVDDWKQAEEILMNGNR